MERTTKSPTEKICWVVILIVLGDGESEAQTKRIFL